MEYRLNRLDEPVFITVSKPLLTEFGIHHRLESCERVYKQLVSLRATSHLPKYLMPVRYFNFPIRGQSMPLLVWPLLRSCKFPRRGRVACFITLKKHLWVGDDTALALAALSPRNRRCIFLNHRPLWWVCFGEIWALPPSFRFSKSRIRSKSVKYDS